jgi:hypothetical protein
MKIQILISLILSSSILTMNAQTYELHNSINFNDVNDGRDVPDGITWFKQAPLDWGIFRTSGLWSSPNYQQLRLAFQTGIIIDGGNLYGKSGTILQPNEGNVGIGTTSIGLQTILHVKEAGSSIAIWKGRIVASGALNAVVMGERNGKAWFGAHNAELNQWSDLIIQADGGNIGVGTENPSFKLDVNGTIHAKEVKVDLNFPADYVFKSDYKLMPLTEVEQFVKTNRHLPEIPSATEIKENGLNMGEMQNKLLQKIEELTLYTIEQNKKIIELEKQNAKINALEEKIKKLESASK